MLRIERPLALLEPCVLEKFKDGEEDRDSPGPIFFARAIPIFDHPGECARKFNIVGLWPKEIDQ